MTSNDSSLNFILMMSQARAAITIKRKKNIPVRMRLLHMFTNLCLLVIGGEGGSEGVVRK